MEVALFHFFHLCRETRNGKTTAEEKGMDPRRRQKTQTLEDRIPQSILEKDRTAREAGQG